MKREARDLGALTVMAGHSPPKDARSSDPAAPSRPIRSRLAIRPSAFTCRGNRLDMSGRKNRFAPSSLRRSKRRNEFPARANKLPARPPREFSHKQLNLQMFQRRIFEENG